LYQRYQHCFNDTANNDSLTENDTATISAPKTKAKRKKCVGRDEKLMFILRDTVNEALFAGHKVHVTGHSLGGGLATLLALDIILNFPSVPISKLNLWTFGAPQVADEMFLESAMNFSPRLKAYIQNQGGRLRYHRYVTLSDKCKADLVSTITSKALLSDKRGLRGRLVRRLGGVGGEIIHIAEPHYLFPLLNETAIQDKKPPAKTNSTFGTHHITSYLQGISRESLSHPLMSNLPVEASEFVGEVPLQKSTNCLLETVFL
jgi:hypothetical protein